jgi:hypothetical protein
MKFDSIMINGLLDGTTFLQDTDSIILFSKEIGWTTCGGAWMVCLLCGFLIFRPENLRPTALEYNCAETYTLVNASFILQMHSWCIMESKEGEQKNTIIWIGRNNETYTFIFSSSSGNAIAFWSPRKTMEAFFFNFKLFYSEEFQLQV